MPGAEGHHEERKLDKGWRAAMLGRVVGEASLRRGQRPE